MGLLFIRVILIEIKQGKKYQCGVFPYLNCEDMLLKSPILMSKLVFIDTQISYDQIAIVNVTWGIL